MLFKCKQYLPSHMCCCYMFGCVRKLSTHCFFLFFFDKNQVSPLPGSILQPGVTVPGSRDVSLMLCYCSELSATLEPTLTVMFASRRTFSRRNFVVSSQRYVTSNQSVPETFAYESCVALK